MSSTPALDLVRVHNSESISAVANTISLSFSDDPLIRWLRPNAPPWAKQQPGTSKWQYRRVQRAVLEGMVFRSASAAQAHTSRRKHDISTDPGLDAGSAVILFPPKGKLKWTLSRAILALKLWFLDSVYPALDSGADEQRLEKLMTAHDAAIDAVKARYHVDDLWYLEVVAAHPSLQGRGLGGKAMNWVLDYIEHQPIVLECTAERNVNFYESLGFKVVEEVDLADDKEAIKCWVMFRPQSNS